ncbi:hypothetical protein SeMB42_g04563 [Synchytrium endobioticum]|uniref:AB hydrolase-1 domain-containing protein n=1 Tax=Synchytrium endobioticum TaxID=286115 RepID=A0A507CX86_9FUNG|nr:hypothetical protein SeMB42_g04561 [Synchytrium endobioticum]TPX43844.1 hypothetical protein SeMB42_g04563 [Synchytrium endobioticum]
MLYKYQTALIYPANFPDGSRTVVWTPDKFNMPDYEDLTLSTADKVKIRAYLIKNKVDVHDRSRSTKSIGQDGLSPYTLLYLHANAGNMGHRLPFAYHLHRILKCNILLLSYRGYGLSEGSPDEAGIRLDAQAALDYITSHPTLRFSKVIVFGQSIGGAVAIHLASADPERVHGLVVENTFLSLPRLIPHIMPVVARFSFLCHQIWPSYKAITAVPRTIPILMLSGLQDELVPASHMHALARICRAYREDASVDIEAIADSTRTDKEKTNASAAQELVKDQVGVRFVGLRNGRHNDTCIQPGYFEQISQWWEAFIVNG